MNCANIIAEGPSALTCTPGRLLDGPLVAINRAIAALWRPELASPTVFAAWDWPVVMNPHPGHNWEGFTAKELAGLEVWVNPLTEQGWKNRGFPPGQVVAMKGPHEARGGTWPFSGACKNWMGYVTVCAAISECVWHGAKHIRLFGVDMKGDEPGVFGGPPIADTARRWRVERYYLSRMMRDARKIGIRLERVRPAPRESSAPCSGGG